MGTSPPSIATPWPSILISFASRALKSDRLLDKAEAERKTKLRQTLLAGLPGELAARVGALGRRSPPDAVRDVVLDLLHQRPWRLEELGQLLQRNPEYVRQKYVRPLLEAARIRMTRPEVPNDPDQAYRAVEERP